LCVSGWINAASVPVLATRPVGLTEARKIPLLREHGHERPAGWTAVRLPSRTAKDGVAIEVSKGSTSARRCPDAQCHGFLWNGPEYNDLVHRPGCKQGRHPRMQTLNLSVQIGNEFALEPGDEVFESQFLLLEATNPHLIDVRVARELFDRNVEVAVSHAQFLQSDSCAKYVSVNVARTHRARLSSVGRSKDSSTIVFDSCVPKSARSMRHRACCTSIQPSIWRYNFDRRLPCNSISRRSRWCKTSTSDESDVRVLARFAHPKCCERTPASFWMHRQTPRSKDLSALYAGCTAIGRPQGP
jgi:hypothetical protein